MPPSDWFSVGPRVLLVALAGGVIAISFLTRQIWRLGEREYPSELWKPVLWFVRIARVCLAVLVWGLDTLGTDYDILLWSRQLDLIGFVRLRVHVTHEPATTR